MVIATLALAAPERADAQACCAGSSAITPARLTIHEQALVGFQARAADMYGSFDGDGRYAGAPDGASELDFGQDFFAAARLSSAAQLAALIPFVETRRKVPGSAEFGGGVGDVNLGGRYDFYLAGQSLYVPGIAVLAGLTLPSGTAPDESDKPLATDATGIGTFQGTLGVALEQTYGRWLFNVTALGSKRAEHSANGVTETLATQLTLLGATAYAFDNDAALGFVVSYTFEGDAVVNDVEAPGSGRRVLQLSLSGVWPLSDDWRLLGNVSLNPPAPHLGKNMPAGAGLTLGFIKSWS